jgi:hypothetical protein
MRGRVLLYVVLASSLTFLVSLFLPWRESPAAPSGNGVLSLFNQFASGSRSVDGWVTGAGDVAVLLVVALILAAVVALRRPQLAPGLPIGSLGVALGYFAAAAAVAVHSVSDGLLVSGLHMNWAYGAYVGLASGAVAALGGVGWSLSKLRRPQTALDLVALVLGMTLLISFLLPWLGFEGPNPRSPHGVASLSYPGITSAAAAIAALGLLLGAPRLNGEPGRPLRLLLAIATAILTGAAATVVYYVGVHRYGTWIGVGCAVLLVTVEVARAWPLRLAAVPHGLTALRVGALVLLLVALFLPWEQIRNGPSTNGWSSVLGAAAGSLCLLLLAAPALPVFEDYVLEAVVAIVFLVSALAAAFRENQLDLRVDYGAFVGIAAAGILLVLALLRLRPGRVEPRRTRARAVPIAASVLCVAAVVLPWWFVLPQNWSFQDAALSGWLPVPGLLLGLYLVRLWILQLRGSVRSGSRLVLVPLVLLTLAALELIRYRDAGVVWSAVILVGLCLVLMLYGWIEERNGLEGFRVPEEIWRVDRLPGAEG